MNNYRSSWPIDNDDGSNGCERGGALGAWLLDRNTCRSAFHFLRRYIESNNFLLWGGSKQYLGFNKHMLSNIYVYADYRWAAERSVFAIAPSSEGPARPSRSQPRNLP